MTTTVTTPHLHSVPPAQALEAAQVFTAANHDTPLWRHVFPEPAHRARALPMQFALRLRWGQQAGQVLATSEGLEGVSILLPGEAHSIPMTRIPWLGGLALLRAAGVSAARRLIALDCFYSRRHTRLLRRPHLYLGAIAVRPDRQGQGLGGELLREALAQADASALPCFLETQMASNVELYRHFGFEVIDEVRVPSVGINDWAMIRR